VKRQVALRRPAVERLRRLRWLLTAIFTAMNTVGLVVFAPLIIGLDAQSHQDAVDARVRLVAASVLRLVRDDDPAISLERVAADDLNDACPQFAILPGVSARFEPYRSQQRCVEVDEETLNRLVQQAVSSGSRLIAQARAVDGGRVRIGVEPFRTSDDGRYAGAVVAWSGMGPENEEHRRLVLLVLIGCVFLVAAAAAGGYALSGRAIRPAAAALEQQEVLLAETAHDLRTPVAALRALAETAAQDPAQRAELLPRTVRLAGRMGDIIDGLLVRARLAAGVEQLSMQPVWLDQLVAGLVEDTPADGARVSVVTAPTKVRADPALVQRAIGNLLDNALRHGREPGREAVVTVTVADGRVTVADRGPGVGPGLPDELFERFTSGGGSSGLGLSIVRWVALAHGGELLVHNADEGGAIFEFRLPVAEDL
jgi:two-component system OmpR family sensor kinase